MPSPEARLTYRPSCVTAASASRSAYRLALDGIL